MFKKTLIAAALASTAIGANASTVAVTPVTVGVEYAQGVGQIVGPEATISLGRAYAAGDIIQLKVTGATLATVKADGKTAVVPTISISGTSGVVEFLQYQDNATRVLVTSDIAEDTGVTITVSGHEVITSDAVNRGAIKFQASGRVATVDGAIDVDASPLATAATYATELASAVTSKFSKTIDVNALRKKFTDGTTADTLVITNTKAAVDAGVTTTGATYTVKGDFSYLDANNDGKLGGVGDGSVTSPDGTVAVAADFQSATVTASDFVDGTVGITVSSVATVIPDQSFTATVTAKFEDPKGGATDLSDVLVEDGSAGSWTLNGAKAHIPFLPFSSGFSQAVTVSNTSAQTGGVDLVFYVGNDTVEVEAVATVVAEGVTDLSKAIKDAVSDAGLSGNIAIDVIINAPEDAIKVEALYYSKADQDRLRTL